MGQLVYNGVSLPYPFTTQFSQQGVGDDSDTDLVYTRFDIRTISLVNANYLAVLLPDITGLTSVVDMMTLLRQRLLARRRALSYTFNNVELIPQPPPPQQGTVDARNGPIPQHCEITQLTDTTFIIDYRIIAHFVENTTVKSSPGGGPGTITRKSGSDVVNNRWTERVEYDNCQYATRTREGKFILRSDNARGVIADDLRDQFAVVGVPKGFLRDSSSYTVDPSGLVLAYRVVDKEKFKAPPVPAFEATGTYTETYGPSGPGIGIRRAVVHVRLKGDKRTPQDDLYNAAMKIVVQKMFINGFPGAAAVSPASANIGGIWEQFTVKGGMYENTIEITARALMSSGRKRIQGINMGAGYSFNWTPLSDGDLAGGFQKYTPPYSTAGTSNILLHAAAYFDPKLATTALILNPLNGQTKTGEEPGSAGVNKE